MAAGERTNRMASEKHCFSTPRRVHQPLLTIIPCRSMPLAEIVMCISAGSVSSDPFQAILNLRRKGHTRAGGVVSNG